jgi:hypothetical protein
MSKRTRGEMFGQPSLDLFTQRPASHIQLPPPLPRTTIPHAPPPAISYALHYLPSAMHHPPFSWNFLELYNDTCQCETQLNAAVSPIEIRDVLDDCSMFLHRMSDQGDMTLYDRIVDLECNIRCKLTRTCKAALLEASATAESIHRQYFQRGPRTSLLSQEDAEAIVRTLDEYSVAFDPSMLELYKEIRSNLAWYITIETSSDEESEDDPTSSIDIDTSISDSGIQAADGNRSE